MQALAMSPSLNKPFIFLTSFECTRKAWTTSWNSWKCLHGRRKRLFSYERIFLDTTNHCHLWRFCHLFFKQIQTEPTVLFVFQKAKSKILETLGQNWGCSSSALHGRRIAKFDRSPVFGCLNQFSTWYNYSFGPNSLKF